MYYATYFILLLHADNGQFITTNYFNLSKYVNNDYVADRRMSLQDESNHVRVVLDFQLPGVILRKECRLLQPSLQPTVGDLVRNLKQELGEEPVLYLRWGQQEVLV